MAPITKKQHWLQERRRLGEKREEMFEPYKVLQSKLATQEHLSVEEKNILHHHLKPIMIGDDQELTQKKIKDIVDQIKKDSIKSSEELIKSYKYEFEDVTIPDELVDRALESYAHRIDIDFQNEVLSEKILDQPFYKKEGTADEYIIAEERKTKIDIKCDQYVEDDLYFSNDSYIGYVHISDDPIEASAELLLTNLISNNVNSKDGALQSLEELYDNEKEYYLIIHEGNHWLSVKLKFQQDRTVEAQYCNPTGGRHNPHSDSSKSLIETLAALIEEYAKCSYNFDAEETDPRNWTASINTLYDNVTERAAKGEATKVTLKEMPLLEQASIQGCGPTAKANLKLMMGETVRIGEIEISEGDVRGQDSEGARTSFLLSIEDELRLRLQDYYEAYERESEKVGGCCGIQTAISAEELKTNPVIQQYTKENQNNEPSTEAHHGSAVIGDGGASYSAAASAAGYSPAPSTISAAAATTPKDYIARLSNVTIKPIDPEEFFKKYGTTFEDFWEWRKGENAEATAKTEAQYKESIEEIKSGKKPFVVLQSDSPNAIEETIAWRNSNIPTQEFLLIHNSGFHWDLIEIPTKQHIYSSPSNLACGCYTFMNIVIHYYDRINRALMQKILDGLSAEDKEKIEDCIKNKKNASVLDADLVRKFTKAAAQLDYDSKASSLKEPERNNKSKYLNNISESSKTLSQEEITMALDGLQINHIEQVSLLGLDPKFAPVDDEALKQHIKSQALGKGGKKDSSDPGYFYIVDQGFEFMEYLNSLRKGPIPKLTPEDIFTVQPLLTPPAPSKSAASSAHSTTSPHGTSLPHAAVTTTTTTPPDPTKSKTSTSPSTITSPIRALDVISKNEAEKGVDAILQKLKGETVAEKINNDLEKAFKKILEEQKPKINPDGPYQGVGMEGVIIKLHGKFAFRVDDIFDKSVLRFTEDGASTAISESEIDSKLVGKFITKIGGEDINEFVKKQNKDLSDPKLLTEFVKLLHNSGDLDFMVASEINGTETKITCKRDVFITKDCGGNYSKSGLGDKRGMKYDPKIHGVEKSLLSIKSKTITK